MTPEMIDEDVFVPRPSSWRAALSQLPGYTASAVTFVPGGAGAAARAVSLWEEGEETLDDVLPETPEVDLIADLEELDDEPLDEDFADEDDELEVTDDFEQEDD